MKKLLHPWTDLVHLVSPSSLWKQMGAAENLGEKEGKKTNTKRFVFSEIKEEGQVVSAGNV
jgi:hypothetical protein